MLIGMVILFLAAGCAQRQATADLKVEPTKASVAQVITLREIDDAYSANSVAAEDRFEGKRWRISGTVAVVSSTGAGEPPSIAIIDPGTDITERGCPVGAFHYTNTERARIATLSKGQSVTCEGKFRKDNSRGTYTFDGTLLSAP